MRIPKFPFHNVLADLVYMLFFQGECIRTYTMYISNMTQRLPDMTEAKYAIIVAEADSHQVNKDVIIRFCEDGNDPSPDKGMPLGHMGTYELKGRENLERFCMVGTEDEMNSRVTIQFYA